MKDEMKVNELIIVKSVLFGFGVIGLIVLMFLIIGFIIAGIFGLK